MPPFNLNELKKSPMLIDACILMFAVNEDGSARYSNFEQYRELIFEPLFNSCYQVLIHKAVFDELDDKSKAFVASTKINIVDENDLYKYDAKYQSIFNNIAENELFQYQRDDKLHKGEIYSLAYAAYYCVPYFSSKDIDVDVITSRNELDELKNLQIITFDIVLLIAFLSLKNDENRSNNFKILKSLYKKYCQDVIKRRNLPDTFGDYIRAFQNC